MAKTVFRPGEAKNIEEKVMLPLYKDYSPIEDVEVQEEEEYTGPTAEDLRREAEEYKAQFEQEKQQLKADAQKEAERIIKAAEDTAFAEVKRQTDQAAVIKADAEMKLLQLLKKQKPKLHKSLQRHKLSTIRLFQKPATKVLNREVRKALIKVLQK